MPTTMRRWFLLHLPLGLVLSVAIAWAGVARMNRAIWADCRLQVEQPFTAARLDDGLDWGVRRKSHVGVDVVESYPLHSRGAALQSVNLPSWCAAGRDDSALMLIEEASGWPMRCMLRRDRLIHPPDDSAASVTQPGTAIRIPAPYGDALLPVSPIVSGLLCNSLLFAIGIGLLNQWLSKGIRSS